MPTERSTRMIHQCFSLHYSIPSTKLYHRDPFLARYYSPFSWIMLWNSVICDIFLYVDESTSFHPVTSPQGPVWQNSLNKDLENIKRWADALVTLEIRKSISPDLLCWSTKMQLSKRMEVLGFCIDSKITWTSTLHNIWKHAGQLLGEFYKLVDKPDAKGRVNIFKTKDRIITQYFCLVRLIAS